jgi:hypothetical protein
MSALFKEAGFRLNKRGTAGALFKSRAEAIPEVANHAGSRSRCEPGHGCDRSILLGATIMLCARYWRDGPSGPRAHIDRVVVEEVGVETEPSGRTLYNLLANHRDLTGDNLGDVGRHHANPPGSPAFPAIRALFGVAKRFDERFQPLRGDDGISVRQHAQSLAQPVKESTVRQRQEWPS